MDWQIHREFEFYNKSRNGLASVEDWRWIARFVMNWWQIGIELWEFMRDWYLIGQQF